jgi:hypothetical protein
MTPFYSTGRLPNLISVLLLPKSLRANSIIDQQQKKRKGISERKLQGKPLVLLPIRMGNRGRTTTLVVSTVVVAAAAVVWRYHMRGDKNESSVDSKTKRRIIQYILKLRRSISTAASTTTTTTDTTTTAKTHPKDTSIRNGKDTPPVVQEEKDVPEQNSSSVVENHNTSLESLESERFNAALLPYPNHDDDDDDDEKGDKAIRSRELFVETTIKPHPEKTPLPTPQSSSVSPTKCQLLVSGVVESLSEEQDSSPSPLSPPPRQVSFSSPPPLGLVIVESSDSGEQAQEQSPHQGNSSSSSTSSCNKGPARQEKCLEDFDSCTADTASISTEASASASVSVQHPPPRRNIFGSRVVATYHLHHNPKEPSSF